MTDDLRNRDGHACQKAEEDPSASILTAHAEEPIPEPSERPDEPLWATAPELIRPKSDGGAPWWRRLVRWAVVR